MNYDEFKRILTTFADNPTLVDLSKGQLLVEIRDDIIEAEIYTKDGFLYVRESDIEYAAQQWLIKRVARLPQLADRILSYIPEENSFVTPTSNLLDQLEVSSDDQPQFIENTVSCARDILARRPTGTSSILYLTSDAGEGKTTLINHAAHLQAKAYKSKETDWLLIPITLGGRTFLRFDDVVIGDLVNRFRFQFFYYEAFIELVRLGVVVPAFDGFEEVFIESSSGEALSALGNLVRTLSSSGSVLISARKAYFDYQSFGTRANLFDALKSGSVSFSRLSLNRWSRDQFLLYCEKRGFSDGQAIYNDVSQRLSDTNHPLLTRAVLVKRLLDIADSDKGREALLNRLGYAPHDYFYQFVDAIIEREATEKWIDRSGDPAQPLISSSEHHDLLSLIAQEMWLINTEVLKDDALELIAEIFSETYAKSPTVTRQIKERIKQHALIVSVNSNRSMFAFDHEEFRNFFLGQAIGRRLAENSESDLRILLRTGSLSNQAFDAAVQYLKREKHDLRKAARILQVFSQSDAVTSFTSENCGGLMARLIDAQDGHKLNISKVTFPPNSLRGRSINDTSFLDCYFQSTSLDQGKLNSCNFEQCRFDNIELTGNTDIRNTSFSSCEVISVIPPKHDNRIFDPDSINTILTNAGITILSPAGEVSPQTSGREPDEELEVTERALRYFLRATQINENVLKVRLGVKANFFINELLPQLMRAGIMGEAPNAPSQRRFKLDVQMREIDEAMIKSNGNFKRFLECFT